MEHINNIKFTHIDSGYLNLENLEYMSAEILPQIDFAQILESEYFDLIDILQDMCVDFNNRIVDNYYLETFCNARKTLIWIKDNIEFLIYTAGENFIEKYEQKCMICFENSSDCRKLSCNHFACSNCFKLYIDKLLLNSAKNIKLKCFYPKCEEIIYPYIMRYFYYDSSQRMTLYNQMILEKFLEGHKDQYFVCCNPICLSIIHAPIKTDSCKIIQCKCLTTYCCLCFREPHLFLTCAQYFQWKKDISTHLEKANGRWIDKNTKECPNCRWAIEKNEGCLHMVCFKCKFEFCWNCLVQWKDHKTTSLYHCTNIYHPKFKEKRNQKEKNTIKEANYGTYQESMKNLDVYFKLESIKIELIKHIRMLNQDDMNHNPCFVLYKKTFNSIVIACDIMGGMYMKHMYYEQQIDNDMYFSLLVINLEEITTFISKMIIDKSNRDVKNQKVDENDIIMTGKVNRIINLINILLNKYS